MGEGGTGAARRWSHVTNPPSWVLSVVLLYVDYFHHFHHVIRHYNTGESFQLIIKV